jgi:hypothetical protein
MADTSGPVELERQALVRKFVPVFKCRGSTQDETPSGQRHRAAIYFQQGLFHSETELFFSASLFAIIFIGSVSASQENGSAQEI